MIQGGEGINKVMKDFYNYGCFMFVMYYIVLVYLNKFKIYVRYLKRIRFLKYLLYKLFCIVYEELLRFVFIKKF